ncbi:hypothetical protein 33D_0052, partial [Mycobacterium phage 33D]
MNCCGSGAIAGKALVATASLAELAAAVNLSANSA